MPSLSLGNCNECRASIVRASIFPEGRKIASRDIRERRVKIFVAIFRSLVVRVTFYVLRLRASVNSLASREGEKERRGREREANARSVHFFRPTRPGIVGRRSVNRAGRSSWRKQKRQGSSPAEGGSKKNNSRLQRGDKTLDASYSRIQPRI